MTPAPSNNIGFHLSATLRTENGIVSRFNFGAGAVIADLEADVRYEMSSELYESETVQMEDKYDLNFKTFPEVLGYIPEDIKKVVIENGLNGKSSELTDKTEIQKFLSFFDGTSLYRLWEAPYADSFPISVTMSEGLTDTVWFSFGEGSGVRTSDTAFPDVVYRSDVGFSAEKIRQFVETYGLQ